MSKPVKRIAITDSPVSFIENTLQFVSDQYELELTTDRDADYVFYSVDGYDVLKYSGVRIFVTGENVTPNLAITDYSMDFEKFSYGDRHIWFPLIKLYRKAYQALLAPRPNANEVMSGKTGFCAYVMSNIKDSAPERTEIFNILSSYKQVNSGGGWNNNVGGRVSDKIQFQSQHKFVIAFENSSSVGYLTEKFSEAAASNAVPIYWGDTEISEVFNPKAFINCHDFESFDHVLDHVKAIDQDDDRYRSMLSEPWFLNSHEPEELQDETFAAFLSNIFDQDPASAYRRNRSRWGIKTERRLYDMYHRPYLHGLKLLRKDLKGFWRRR